MEMIRLECYASTPLLFLPIFLYDFIGVLMEIVGGQMRSIRYGISWWCGWWCGLIVPP